MESFKAFQAPINSTMIAMELASSLLQILRDPNSIIMVMSMITIPKELQL
jgi:hypothetical protein